MRRVGIPTAPGVVARGLAFVLPLTLSPLIAQNTLFTEGFESTFPGANWTVGDANAAGSAAYWDDVDSAFGGEGTTAGNRKGYCAGIGFAGTAASPSYTNFMLAFMERTVDLTPFPRARLSFQSKIPSLETGIDSARVLMSGAPVWIQTAPQSAWTPATVDLGPFTSGNHTLRFEFYSDDSITGEGWYLDEIKLLIPPANDTFAAATAISGGAGSINGTTILAGREPGEPQGLPDVGVLATVWFQWTAPASNAYAFTVPRFGTNDAAVHVFSGGTLATLVTLAGEFGLPGGAATAVVSARAGSNYWIRVGGFSGGNNAPENNFQLQWNPATNATQRLFATKSGTNVVVSWFSPAYRLQASPVLGTGASWTAVAGSTPVTLPATNATRFFRLVSP